MRRGREPTPGGGGRIVWTDAMMLGLLEMRIAEGMSFGDLSKAWTRRLGRPVSRSALIGICHRISTEDAAASTDHDAGADGSMQPRWWEHGLRMRAAAKIEA